MFTLLRLEFSKLYRRRATYVAFAVLLALVLLIAIPISCYQEEMEKDMRKEISRSLGGDWAVGGKMMAGPFIPRFMLFLPLRVMVVNTLLAIFATLVAAGTIAGEYSSGTLRTILTRPPKRWKVYTAKFIVVMTHSAVLSLFLGLAACIVGYILFGRGTLTFMDEPGMGGGGGGLGRFFIPEGEALKMLGVTYLLLAAAVSVAGALGYCVSAMTSSSLSAAGICLGTLLVSKILDTLGMAGGEMGGGGVLQFFADVRPYLPTTHMDFYALALNSSPDWGEVWHSGLWLIGYVAAFFALGLIVFRRREILC